MTEKVITTIHVLTDGTLVGIEVGGSPAVYVSKDGVAWDQVHGAKASEKKTGKEG
jgi:hypothetical protein